ncbi:MAG TPA: glycosyltransferase family 4 protein [Thermodesulfobacteriota bacterium]|nr:glycosyltransferase family 4 protein [Thermodesulfobacteriota bacterium]
MKRIKVVHIITKLELGGAQENTLFTVAHLDRSRFEPFLISGNEGILAEEAQRIGGVKTYLLPDLVREISLLHDTRAFTETVRTLKEIRSSGDKNARLIVHTHSSKAGIIGRWAAKTAGAEAIIHTYHGFGFNDYQPWLVKWFYILLEWLTSRITTRFICVSEANREKGIALGLFREDQTALIRSGIDLERFASPQKSREETRKELGIPLDTPLATMIACFKPQKAPLDFVRVAGLVKKEMPHVRFLMVGDGILRNEIEQARRECGVEQELILPGWRRDIPEILNATDCLVLTSLWEGLPRVFPQAMCLGLPVVATRVDGATDVISDNVNGFLLPPRDCEGMAQKVLYLLKNPDRAKEMGERGRAQVKEFDSHTMVKQQEELYFSLV